MTDQPQGPEWWLASDGKWYPPDQAPAVPPRETWAAAATPSPPSGGMSSGAKVALIVGVSILVLVVLAGLAALLLGTDSTSSSQSTESTIDVDGGAAVEVPDGYALIEGEGVSIAVPEDWQEIAPDDFAMSAEEYAEAFPDAPEGMFEQGSMLVDRGAVLAAFGLTDDFSSNVNILNAPGEAPLGVVEDQVGSELSSFGAEGLSFDRVDLPAGEALRVEYTLDVALPDGRSLPASGVQYYVPFDGRTYIVTVSTRDQIDELAEIMADTFRVT